MGKRITQKSFRYYTEIERHQIVQELLSTGCRKSEIWKKYTGELADHGHLLRWMRKAGYNEGIMPRRSNIVSNFNNMAKAKNDKAIKEVFIGDENFENLQLKNRIVELEKQLKDAELKAIAFSTMVDIAEQEFKIPIRKKYNTKP